MVTWWQLYDINHKHIKQSPSRIRFFPRAWSNEFINFKEIPETIITMTPDNRFYLIIPVDTFKVRKCNVAALDPGVKIFQTVYGSDNVAYTIGENDINWTRCQKLPQE